MDIVWMAECFRNKCLQSSGEASSWLLVRTWSSVTLLPSFKERNTTGRALRENVAVNPDGPRGLGP